MEYSLKELKQKGIYQIINKVDGKCYVGQTRVSFKARWKQHRNRLRRNGYWKSDKKNGNKHLQSAWNLYGEENFEFRILEVLPKDKKLLAEREDFWMKLCCSLDRRFGYNLKGAGEHGGHSEETKQILSIGKMGELNPMYGKECSDEHKQNISLSLVGVPKPPRSENHCRNLSESNCEYLYYAKSPEGIEYTFSNLNTFCKEHNLIYPNMQKVMTGQYKQCKGWTGYSLNKDGTHRPLTIKEEWVYELTSPEGLVIETDNYAQVCKQYGLSKPAISRLLSGKRKTHKGWKARKYLRPILDYASVVAA